MALSQTDLDAIQQASNSTGVPYGLLIAQATAETGSQANPDTAVSSTGATGLFQILGSTAASPGYGINPIGSATLTNPYVSSEFAAEYDKGLASANGGNYNTALSKYSGGAYTESSLMSQYPQDFTTAGSTSAGTSVGSTPSSGGLLSSIGEYVERGFIGLLGVGIILICLVFLLMQSKTVTTSAKTVAEIAA